METFRDCREKNPRCCLETISLGHCLSLVMFDGLLSSLLCHNRHRHHLDTWSEQAAKPSLTAVRVAKLLIPNI